MQIPKVQNAPMMSKSAYQSRSLYSTFLGLIGLPHRKTTYKSHLFGLRWLIGSIEGRSAYWYMYTPAAGYTRAIEGSTKSLEEGRGLTLVRKQVATVNRNHILCYSHCKHMSGRHDEIEFYELRSLHRLLPLHIVIDG